MDWNNYFIQGTELIFLGVGSYFDIRDRELPVAFLTFFGFFGILANAFWRYQSLNEVLLGSLPGVSFLMIGWLTKEAIGYGDGIGLVILGIFEGVHGVLSIILGAFLLSGIYGLWSLWGLKKSGSDTMPFYPFLFLAFMKVVLI